MEDVHLGTPRSARTKKKSTLSRLAERHQNQSDDSDASSSYNSRPYSSRPESLSSGYDRGSRHRHPVDADVHVTQHGVSNDDSDEGIGLGTNSTAYKSPGSTSDFRERSAQRNYNRIESDSDSAEERNKIKRNSAGRYKLAQTESDDDDDDDNDNNNQSPRQSRYNQYQSDVRTNLHSNSRYIDNSSGEKSPQSYSPSSPLDDTLNQRDDIENRYRQILASADNGHDIGPDQRKTDSPRAVPSRSYYSDTRSYDRQSLESPRPHAYNSVPRPSSTSPVPHHSKNTTADFSFPTSSLYKSFLRSGEIGNATSEIGSMTSTSALPLISTKEARNRSFLLGSANASGSMLGSEELKRFFPENKMRIFVGTWNMAEMKNPPGVIDDFLLPESTDYMHDVYVIGTQESSSNRAEWELSLQETLGPQMVLFHSASFGALHMCVFMRRDLIWYCSVTEEATISTRPGPSGIKTKGGLGVCFTMFGTSFLFIDSHFTAHDGKFKERIEDYNKICAGLNLPKELPAAPATANNSDVTTRFDCVFWMGDLNFRLEKERERVDYKMKGIEAEDVPRYEDLLKFDELARAQAEDKAFSAFCEGRIKFKPTYKFDPGTEKYDTSSKLRIPSYTDRILYRSRKKGHVMCLHYSAAHSVLDSDHHPVYGTYEVILRPGRDNVALSGGKFDQAVWKEGIRRRAHRNAPTRSQKSSSVCAIM